jgi:hypothetical protein
MATATQLNGYRPAVTEQQNVQAGAFYDQWLQLKEIVLADGHERFKLPAAVKERLGPVIAEQQPSTSSPSSMQTNTAIASASANASMGQASSSQYSGTVTRVGNAHAFSQNMTNTTKPSGIDPVLLTKSDDLIKAEMHLKRLRIERQLKESAEQRKHHGAPIRNNEDTPALPGLSETFDKALEMVKPMSGLLPPANAKTAASDSFDENSYYSSQVNDWSSEDASPKDKNETNKLILPIDEHQHEHQHGHQHDHQHDHLTKQSTRHVQHESEHVDKHQESEAVYDGEREDSEEYSPPAADAFSGLDGEAMDLDDGKFGCNTDATSRLSKKNRQQRIHTSRRRRSFTTSTTCKSLWSPHSGTDEPPFAFAHLNSRRLAI